MVVRLSPAASAITAYRCNAICSCWLWSMPSSSHPVMVG